MFSKFFFTALAFTLALSAFSSESQVAGRYRVEGPGNSGGTSAQAGRYRAASDVAVYSTGQSQDSWAQTGQARVAGRYNSSQSDYASARSYNYAPQSAEMRSYRAPAANVSTQPGDRASQPDHK